MTPCPILLFPCNGNCVEALDCLGDAWECIGFVDDAPEKQGRLVHGIRVHDRLAFSRWPHAFVLALPGGPASFLNRRRVVEGLDVSESRYARVIHPRASVSPRAAVGSNTLIMVGAVLTANAMVGRHCCILPNSVIHHDSRVGDWTLVGANVTIAGGVDIGLNCYIGGASSIMNGLRIGDRSMVAFGANVIRDVAADTRVAGNPARELRQAGS